jgi:hypothetical protein
MSIIENAAFILEENELKTVKRTGDLKGLL